MLVFVLHELAPRGTLLYQTRRVIATCLQSDCDADFSHKEYKRALNHSNDGSPFHL